MSKHRLIRAAAALALTSVAATASAHSVYGLIFTKWHALGEASGAMGAATSDEQSDGLGGRIQSFDFGWISFIPGRSEALATWGNIARAWSTRYLGLSGLGRPVTDEMKSHTGTRHNLFEKGALYYSVPPKSGCDLPNRPDTCVSDCENPDGVCAIYGVIYEKWKSAGGEKVLGYPLYDERSYCGNGRIQYFSNDWAIYWDPNRTVMLGPDEITDPCSGDQCSSDGEPSECDWRN
jgi:uncharacterized protein with LGFP repeats